MDGSFKSLDSSKSDLEILHFFDARQVFFMQCRVHIAWLLALGSMALSQEPFGPGAVEPITPKEQYGEGVRPTGPLAPEAELAGFHVPPGFVVELVAAEPTIQKPLNMAFDTLGRLWVTNTVEYPYPAPDDRKPRDSLIQFPILFIFATRTEMGYVTVATGC
jgi:hypothetical protein